MERTEARTEAQTELLRRHALACEYPGQLDAPTVEHHLTQYLVAIGVQRTIVRLPLGWQVDDYPALARTVDAVLEDFAKRSGRRPLTRDARDARDALAAR